MSRSLLAVSSLSDSTILAAHSFLLAVSFLSDSAILAVSLASDSFILAVNFLSMAIVKQQQKKRLVGWDMVCWCSREQVFF
jgi:hypothetical protein